MLKTLLKIQILNLDISPSDETTRIGQNINNRLI